MDGESNALFYAGGYQIQIARCEDCGGDALFTKWPAGWTQSGGSKYGIQYQRAALAWHCPRCTQVRGQSGD